VVFYRLWIVCMLMYAKNMTYSDQVIEFVRHSYLEPAAKSGESLVRIKAGDVHKALRWTNRVPSVCQALASKRFLEENHLELVATHGPPSGLSTTTVYTYRVKSGRSETQKQNGLRALRGRGKEMFRRLGGAEKWLLRERANFYSSQQKEERRIGKKS
jgi:hypothetical protein